MDSPATRNLNFKDPGTWIALWFGCGLMKPGPGTWGSLGALPFGIIILVLGGPTALLLAALFLFPVGLWASGIVEKATGEHDLSMIVIDEVVGQWIALAAAALAPVYIVLAFVFFRFFDILKPWPVCYFDRKVNGAWGVMLDDVAAGIMAAACLIGIRWYAGPG
jgi:phosphatidylglycerophosphatase A